MSNVCICNEIFKILCEMKTVQLQKHLSSNFSPNLILARVHSKSPCRRRDKGFHSAGEDDSENRWFRDLKKYYIYRYGCPIKDVKQRRTRWREYRLFCLLFCTVYGSGNRLKINITPYGESSIIQLTKLKFKIWRVTVLKSTLPLRNYEIDFSFLRITDLWRAYASEMKKSM